MNDYDQSAQESQDIAIVGLACRFPSADDPEAFWQNIASGTECVTRFSDEELEAAGVPFQLRQHPDYVPARAIIEGADEFDAAFFGLSPTEAKMIDPQQRVFLETSWAALEDAGIDPGRFDGLIGVYGGADESLHAAATLVTRARDMAALLGNNRDYLATRVAFKLNLKGPALTIQTACSTSLVAVQVACGALLSWQCDVALAGGVGISFPQRVGYLYQEGGVMSPDGHTRTFDAAGRGTVGGDGCGLVVLKRLDDALEQGDTIRAVIRGAAINNDGADKIAFIAPSIDGQAEVIASALAVAGVTPETVTYVEAHGTATELGDPIEMAALDEVFKAGTDERRFCAIGSVKTNVGHMNSASGVGGLIKTVMALQKRQLPPSLHYVTPNPSIDFADSCFVVNTELRPWEPPRGVPRRAGVSSFGAGGTNAHALLEEAPEPPPASEEAEATLIALSARTEAALEQVTTRLLDHIDAHPELSLADIGWTTLVGRRRFKYRRAAVVRERSELRQRLTSTPPVARHRSATPSVVWLFPGQEAQHPGMTRGLYHDHPTYRAAIDECAELLDPLLGQDLRHLIFEGDERLYQTDLAQPALFAVEHSLARLLMSWGVEPEAMLGHSLGEYVAACLAGVFTLGEALSLMVARGRLVQKAPPGAMLAVVLTEVEARPFARGLEVAAVNAPAATVLSGSSEAVDSAVVKLTAEGVAHRRLHTSRAFHSAMMEPVLDELRRALERCDLQPPERPYLSNLTGTWVSAEEATDRERWVQHLRRTVRFSDGLRELLKDPNRVFVEVGPGRTLTTLLRRHDADATAISVAGGPKDEQGSDGEHLLEALGGVWASEVELDWRAVYEGQGRRQVPLPTYPFQRERFPVDLSELPSGPTPAAEAGRLPEQDWLSIPSWRRAGPPQPVHAIGPWLLFDGDSPLAHAIADRLEGRVYHVRPGAGFGRQGDDFTVDPRSRQDLDALIAEVFAEAPPRAAIHTWCLGPAVDFDEAQSLGPLCLLHLVQALGARPLRLGVVADQLFDVVGDEPLDVARAPLAACRVFGQERPELTVRLVDAPPDETGLAWATLAAIEGDEGWVAFRGGRRWLPAHERIRVVSELPRLRPRVVVLIAGGLGHVGMSHAELLAEACQARLVLTGRSGIVPPEEWDDWLGTHSPRDPLSRRISRIRAMEAMGAEVLALGADVADPERMARVFEQAEARFGPVQAMIHAAGASGRAAFLPLDETTPRQLEAHLRVKALGLAVLDDLAPSGLDFKVALGSLSTELGGVGLFAYAAGNHLLDAVAARTDWVCVDWDGWLPPDQGGRIGPEVPAIRVEEGRRTFGRILALAGIPRVLVSTLDLDRRRAEVERFVHQAARSRMARPGEVHPRPELENEYLAPRDELETALAGIWQKVFGLDRVGVEDNFFRLGGDSLMAIQLKAQLWETLAVDLAVDELFEDPTVAGLARKVEAALQDQEALRETLDMVEGLSDEEVEQMLAELEE